MVIIVPIVEPETWRRLHESSDEPGKLFTRELEAGINGTDPPINASVHAYLEPLCRSVDAASGSPATRPQPQDGESPAEKRDDVTLPANAQGQWPDSGTESVEHLQNEAVLLVPEPTKSDTRLYPDQLIVLMPESGKFDTIQPWVRQIARHIHCRIALLTVLALDEGQNGALGTRFTTAHQRLKQCADELRARGARATWEVRMGEPAQEISRLAETTGTNLILMPAPQGGGSEHELIDALLNRSNLYVLLVT